MILWLDDFPHTPQQRSAFEQYMEHGGGWLGFHIAAYNDSGTKWPWFLSFLGGGVFYGNSWPPMPAKITADDPKHPVTRQLPSSFLSPSNEWYIWRPSPRENKDVKVLLTLSPTNYPLGMKDVVRSGDLPVMWTNTRYRMLYMNMGHGDRIFTSDIQNRLMEDAMVWVGEMDHR
jgi:type 1 glutamine amidotransferase